MKSIARLLDIVARYGWSTALVIIAVIAVGFTWSTSDEIISTIRLFDRVALMVDQNYVEKIDRTKMVKAGVDGMLEKLDKYTAYLDGSDFLRLRQTTDGKIDGIGVFLEYHRDTLTVTSVVKGTPGDRAGLHPGDRILSIDTFPTSGLDMSEIRPLLAGQKGTSMSLLVSRPGGREFRVSAAREEVDIDPIPYYGMVAPGIGYIRLSRFSEDCAAKMEQSIKNLTKSKMTSLVLDLRGNPGGLLTEAIRVAGAFLPEDVSIVETRGRDGMLLADYYSFGEPVWPHGGLAVLIDEYTASAAEIVAGAIQDHDRGVILGSPSYGKGMVQQILMVSDNTALKLTTSRYLLPSGRCLQKPDWSDFELMPSTSENERPDSIYFTSGGRPVFGGGGIIPDLNLDLPPVSDYVNALDDSCYIFDFAAAFVRANGIENDFEIDDQVLSEFRKFVEKSGFEFEGDERSAYNGLKSSLRADDDRSVEAMATIDRQIRSREQWRFESNYEEISERLEQMIFEMALGEGKWYEARISRSRAVRAAVEVLSNDQKYASVFAQP